MGLFAEMADLEPSPVSVILITHHMDESKEAFDAVKINDELRRGGWEKFNYNDTVISCIEV